MVRFLTIISVLFAVSVSLEAKVARDNQLFDAKQDTGHELSLKKRSTGYTHAASSIWGKYNIAMCLVPRCSFPAHSIW
ncbi:hypothetical protein OS493_033270 [Desmophyllum pertusum]|uniref:Uncharacterized protein n=1 Tax=Desmophyllum pertusum TaxID=174260 RepID=A0A9X0D0I7_9CNID|nr:hypothetical protein OS493_033270 [Desmophyllum pertusum]